MPDFTQRTQWSRGGRNVNFFCCARRVFFTPRPLRDFYLAQRKFGIR
jgi:hypothetical protein